MVDRRNCNMIFKKHDINHFYVGELYIGSPLGIVQKKTITYKDLKKLEKALGPKEHAVMNGAIVFEETTKGTILNLRKCRIFDGPLLTIFYYDGQDFLCLHNGKSYQTDGTEFCRNLYPLSTLLPSLGFQFAEEITFRQAKAIFTRLFHGRYQYPNDMTMYPLDDFYIGKIKLLAYNKLHYSSDVPIHYILKQSDAKKVASFSRTDLEEEFKYYYEEYECLFLHHGDQYYNLHNYQKYDDLDMPPVSLKNQLEESAPEELTLTKALKLYQGVKR